MNHTEHEYDIIETQLKEVADELETIRNVGTFYLKKTANLKHELEKFRDERPEQWIKDRLNKILEDP